LALDLFKFIGLFSVLVGDEIRLSFRDLYNPIEFYG
jgi:hypothetical protein